MAISSSTVDELLIRNAVNTPLADALIFNDGRRLGWGELHAQSDILARGLLAEGVESGQRVAIHMPNSVEWALTFYALAKIGAVAVPVHIRNTTAEIAFLLRESSAVLLVGKLTHGARNYEVVLADAVARAANVKMIWVDDKGSRKFASGMGLSDIMQAGRSASAAALEIAKKRVRSDDALIVQYTSGTTGSSKGVRLGHGQTLRSASEIAAHMDMTAADRFFSPMPFFHIGGTAASLVSGVALCSLDRFAADEALAMMEREKCTCHCGVESMMIDLIAHPDFARRDLSRLRAGWTNRNERVFEVFSGLINVYAMSECSSAIAMSKWDDPLTMRRDSSGKPFDGVEIRVVNPSSFVDAPDGATGLILVRGWCVMQGYDNAPEATAQAILPGGWFNTGDYGRLSSGLLSYEGRMKDVFRVGGENVASMEVEGAINAYEAVLRSAVVPVPHLRLQHVAWAFVQLKDGKSATADAIIDHCRSRLASFKIPRRVIFTPEFPMTATNKILKTSLVEQARRILAETDAT